MRLFLSKCVVPVAMVSMLATVAGCKDGGEPGGSGGASTAETATGTQTGAGQGGAGQGGAGTGGAGSGGDAAQTSVTGGAGTPGWTVVPLLDDERDPDEPIWHGGNSLVTGIHFTSLDDGFVTASGDEQTFLYGGALFRATQNEVTEILISGDGTGTCISGSVDFGGIEKTADGFVAVAHACDLFESRDGGATFVNDASHIWVGGEYGILMSNSAGGR